MGSTKFMNSVAASCRYGDVAEELWGDWDLVWEDSVADYQGSAEFLAHKDGKFVYYEWSYGSCSGCDTWEAAALSDEEIAAEMKRDALVMDDGLAVRQWAELTKNKAMEVALLRFLVDNAIIKSPSSFVI